MNPWYSINLKSYLLHNFGTWMSFLMLLRFEEDLKVKYKVPLDIVKIEANPAYDAIHVSKKEET